MTTVERFSKALLTYAEQINSIAPLERERDALFAKIETGGAAATDLVNSTVEGKTFGWQVSMTREDKFAALVSAISAWNNDAGSGQVTMLDFSRMNE